MKVQQRRAPAEEPQIRALEAALRASLPSEYADFLRENNGGYSPDAEIDMPSGESSGVISFLSIDGTDSILENRSDVRGQMREGLLPIARDGGGNLFALSLDEGELGTVWFWNHDDDSHVLVAPSWNAFLDMIVLSEE